MIQRTEGTGMIRDIHASRQKTARVAGATGLLTMAIVVVAHYGIQYRLFVPGDAAATASTGGEGGSGSTAKTTD